MTVVLGEAAERLNKTATEQEHVVVKNTITKQDSRFDTPHAYGYLK